MAENSGLKVSRFFICPAARWRKLARDRSLDSIINSKIFCLHQYQAKILKKFPKMLIVHNLFTVCSPFNFSMCYNLYIK